MKTLKSNHLLLAGLLCVGAPAALDAQSYSMNWHKITGGGGASANGQYSVSGAIGQQDAGAALTGGSYSLTGGFWAVVQTAGLPWLTITRAGNNVLISWPDTGSYILQQNSKLAQPAGWARSGYSINSNHGTNTVTITSPPGNLFFRLANP